MEYNQGLHTTWNVSLRQIERRSHTAANLLKFCGYLSNRDIWYELFKGFDDEEYPEWFSSLVRSRIEFTTQMRILCDYGMIEAQQDPAGYGIHSCVHDWIYNILNHQQDTSMLSLALHCVAANFQWRLRTEHRDLWIIRRRLSSHALHLVPQLKIEDNHDLTTLMAMFCLGFILGDENQPDQATRVLRLAFESKVRLLGREHIGVLESAEEIGIVYIRLGRLSEVGMIIEEVLREKWDAESSEVRALDRNDEMYENTEWVLKKILEAKMNCYGPDDHRVLETLTNLSNIYKEAGRIEEAEAMYNALIEASTRISGPEAHPTLRSMHNLGCLYIDNLNRLSDAESLFEKIWRTRLETTGPENTETLRSAHALADVYWRQRKLEEAEKMLSWAVEGKLSVMGPNHLDTIGAMDGLGGLQFELGRYQLASRYWNMVLQAELELFGDGHYRVDRIRDKLDELYRHIEEQQQTEPEPAMRLLEFTEANETEQRNLIGSPPEQGPEGILAIPLAQKNQDTPEAQSSQTVTEATTSNKRPLTLNPIKSFLGWK